MLCYFPTLALTNTLAMKNIVNTEKQFPLVRVFGTIGWIVAGLSLSWIGWDASVNMFKLTAGAAVLLGVYSFTLPHTPPVKTEGGVTARELLGLDAFSLFKRPAFLIFMVASFLVCIPLSFYYILASRVVELVNLPIGQTMSYGQMSEIFFMILMPFFFRKLGVKWMLTVGILTWVIRYVLFAVGAPNETMWMILIGIVVHGICYDFFFVTGQIYTDKVAPEAIRGQAQGMLVLFTLGLGMFIGAQVAGRIETKFTPQASIDHGAEVAALASQLGAEEISPEKTAELNEQKAEARHAQLATMNWKMIWGIPAAIAGVVLLLFVLVFKDDTDEAPAETANAPPAEL
jgi:nucleoside transporter